MYKKYILDIIKRGLKYSIYNYFIILIDESSKKNTTTYRKNDKNKAKEVIESNELDPLEELSIRIDTLVELLSDKGIINKKGYINNVMMRIHESSKAKSFDELEEI